MPLRGCWLPKAVARAAATFRVHNTRAGLLQVGDSESQDFVDFMQNRNQFGGITVPA